MARDLLKSGAIVPVVDSDRNDEGNRYSHYDRGPQRP